MIDLESKISQWAKAKPMIKAIWVFGSRARGDHRDNSDLDLAVELDLSVFDGADDSGGAATWAFDVKPLKEELDKLTGLNVDWQHYEKGVTSVIEAGLSKSSKIIYEKI